LGVSPSTSLGGWVGRTQDARFTPVKPEGFQNNFCHELCVRGTFLKLIKAEKPTYREVVS